MDNSKGQNGEICGKKMQIQIKDNNLALRLGN